MKAVHHCLKWFERYKLKIPNQTKLITFLTWLFSSSVTLSHSQLQIKGTFSPVGSKQPVVLTEASLGPRMSPLCLSHSHWTW